MSFEEWWAKYDPADNLPRHERAFAQMLWAEAVAAERERCAKIAEDIGQEMDDALAVNAGFAIAERIREGAA